MANYSREGFAVKMRFLQQFNKWFPEFYNETGDAPAKTPSNPKGTGITKGRSMRGYTSFLMSPDDVHLDYIDNRMIKGATVKSMMGGLGGRVQNLTSGAKSPYAPVPTDQMHHENVLSAYEPALRQKPEVLQEFLEISDAEGVTYGEGRLNLEGNSQDSRSHTGGRGKPSKTYNPTQLGFGPEGDSTLSSHPRGTNDPGVKLPDRVYESGREMFDAAAPIRAQHAKDVELGNAADTPRRQVANKLLQEANIIEPGVDVFAKGSDPAVIAKAKKFFQQSDDALRQVAEAFDPKLARAIKKGFNANMLGLFMEYGDVVNEMTGGGVDKAINTPINLFREAIGLKRIQSQKPNPASPLDNMSFSQTITTLERKARADKAIKRGGKIPFLPELGISEMLGIN